MCLEKDGIVRNPFGDDESGKKKSVQVLSVGRQYPLGGELPKECDGILIEGTVPGPEQHTRPTL